MQPYPQGESQADRNVERRKRQALAHIDLMRLAMQYAEVEDQEKNDEYKERKPGPEGLAQYIEKQDVHSSPGAIPHAEKFRAPPDKTLQPSPEDRAKIPRKMDIGTPLYNALQRVSLFIHAEIPILSGPPGRPA